MDKITELRALIADLRSRVNQDSFQLTGLAAAHQEVIRRRLTKAKADLAQLEGALAEDASQYADSLSHEESVTAELFRLINACGGACKAEVDATSSKVKGIFRDVIAKTGGTKQPPDPDCETCHGSGVLNVPYIDLATGGRSSKTHEARCMCTFPALAANKEVMRDIFAKLGKDAKR